MKVYDKFHGHVPPFKIEKELRLIVSKTNKSFKILTGYGSTSGRSISRREAIKALAKLKAEHLIKGFLPGQIKHQVTTTKSRYYEDKINFEKKIKYDKDYGNPGIIYIFK